MLFIKELSLEIMMLLKFYLITSTQPEGRYQIGKSSNLITGPLKEKTNKIQ